MVLLVKKTYGYQERDELEREEFMLKLNQIDNNSIVYVDEAGIDNREDYPYGYGVKGKRVPGMKSGKRTERVRSDCSYKSRKNVCSFNICRQL